MSDYVDYAEEIHQRVSIYDIISLYWEEPDSHSRVRCFIHHGKHKNMSVNRRTNKVHCFKCGETRDNIGAVMELFDLNFIDACKKIDYDFNLGLNIGQPLTKEQKLQLKKKQQEREQAKNARELRQKRENYIFNKLCSLKHNFENFVDTLKPTKKSDPDDQFDAYFYYLEKVDTLDWLLNKLTETYMPECENDYKYGKTKKQIYDNFISGKIKLSSLTI